MAPLWVEWWRLCAEDLERTASVAGSILAEGDVVEVSRPLPTRRRFRQKLLGATELEGGERPQRERGKEKAEARAKSCVALAA